jgi:hypothetical protein
MTEEFFSPSKRSKLVVRKIKQENGGWDYTQGELYTDDKLIATILRNYSQFSHSFVSAPDGEYLITGKHYMGITIVNCQTGKEWNFTPPKGTEALCHTRYLLSPDGHTLMACACAWGGPWDWYFYDWNLDKFGPDGLPKLSLDLSSLSLEDQEEFSLDADTGEISFKEDGSIIYKEIKSYHTPSRTYSEDLSERPDLWLEFLPAELKDTFQRELKAGTHHLDLYIRYFVHNIKPQCVPRVFSTILMQREDNKIKVMSKLPESLV